MPDPTFVLLHSPLVGPASWEPVREELHLSGFQAAAPRIEDAAPPYWRSYVDSAAEAITDLGVDDVVLVLHSGAGALAASIADICVPEVAGIVFVDATLPVDGWTRLDELEANAPVFASGVRADLTAGGRFPDWSDALMAPLVPDDQRRRDLLAEVHPRGLDFFEEPIPAPGWPRARVAYLHLSSTYDPQAAHATAEGWPVEQLPLGHFGALADPPAVAAKIITLVEALER